jgi:hypothetical protein
MTSLKFVDMQLMTYSVFYLYGVYVLKTSIGTFLLQPLGTSLELSDVQRCKMLGWSQRKLQRIRAKVRHSSVSGNRQKVAHATLGCGFIQIRSAIRAKCCSMHLQKQHTPTLDSLDSILVPGWNPN